MRLSGLPCVRCVRVCVCGINTSACGFVHTAQLVRGPLFERARELCATAAGATADAVFGGRQVGNVPVLRGPWPCGGGRAVLRRWYYYYYIIIISYIAVAASVSSVVARYISDSGVRRQDGRTHCTAAAVPRAIWLIAIKYHGRSARTATRLHIIQGVLSAAPVQSNIFWEITT